MAYKAYAGIGSRETPQDTLQYMTNFAELCAQEGWTLRSGGANGADKAFEAGVPVSQPYKKEIFLPWGAFEGSGSLLFPPSPLAHEMLKSLLEEEHYENLSEGARKLHARNIHQVLGQKLNDPVKFLICWTPDGKIVGGTATALKVAKMYRVPIFNFGSGIDEPELERIVFSK